MLMMAGSSNFLPYTTYSRCTRLENPVRSLDTCEFGVTRIRSLSQGTWKYASSFLLFCNPLSIFTNWLKQGDLPQQFFIHSTINSSKSRFKIWPQPYTTRTEKGNKRFLWWFTILLFLFTISELGFLCEIFLLL